MRRRPRSTPRTRGSGTFTVVFALTAFLVMLLFTTQLLYGLYARSTVTALATDAARRVAHRADQDTTDASLRDAEAWLRRRLPRSHGGSEVAVTLRDTDRNGRADTVTVAVEVPLPVLLGGRWLPGEPPRLRRTVRARIERFGDDE